MTKSLSLIAVMMNILTFAIPGAAEASDPQSCLRQACVDPPVEVVGSGYSYSYDRGRRVFVGTSRVAVTGGPVGAVFEVAEVVDCGLAGPPGTGGVGDAGPVDCVRARCPAPTAGVVGRWVLVYSRQTAPVVAVRWTQVGRRCVVVTPDIPLAAVTAAVGEHLRKVVGITGPVVQPGQVTLVAFPTIVSTPDPGATGFAIAEPLPGAVAVIPAFGWTFTDPDGTTTTTTAATTGTAGSGAGRLYDGTLPSTPGYYLTHPFTHPGTGSVTVTETWTGSVTVPGVGPVALDPLVLTRTAQLTVRENRPVLIGN